MGLPIGHCDPVKRAQYLRVIFDEVVTFQEIKDGSSEIEKIPGVNELFKLVNSETVSLVRLIDMSWNTIEPSLVLMYEKLVESGFERYDGKIVIIESAAEHTKLYT